MLGNNMISLKAKVWAKKMAKRGKVYKTLYVVIPAPIAEGLNIKEGDILRVTVKQVEIDGKKVNAIVYYKEQSIE